MGNPYGPYPGRQLFVGQTAGGKPCFIYLVTGRSPESRQRVAVQVDTTVRMGPIGDAPYDPLRHYSAVRYDDVTGTLAVSNGIQTDAVYETYKLLVNVGSPRTETYLAAIMEGAQAAPDLGQGDAASHEIHQHHERGQADGDERAPAVEALVCARSLGRSRGT